MDIRYLILVLTTRCNLNCAYCYNSGLRDKTDMSAAVLDRALTLVQGGERPFHLQITGGEPTLVPVLIEQAVRRARVLMRPCTIGIQTNGTCLTPDLVRMFKTFDVQVGVSLDGPPAVHQELRGQVKQTLRGLQLLEDYNVPFRVTTVVSRNNVKYLDRLVWVLAGFGQARGIGLDLLVNKGRAGQDSNVFSAGALALRRGVRSMLAVLRAVNDRRRIPLQLRELTLCKQTPATGDEQRSFCHACQGQSVAAHPDGRLFPCAQTLGDTELTAGTVWQPDPEALTRLKTYKLFSDQCDRCPVSGYCPGECPSRLRYNQTMFPPLVCELYRTLGSEILKQ